jgi:hypothetical protein
MTDRAYEPANPDPFGEFDPDKVGALPAQSAASKPAAVDPFEEFNPFPGQGIKPAAPQTSTLAATAIGAARSALPSAAGMAAFGPGMEVGGAIGSVVGPVGTAVGGLIGGGLAAYKEQEAMDVSLFGPLFTALPGRQYCCQRNYMFPPTN